MTGLLDKFVDHVVEGAVSAEAKKLVAAWVADGYIEADKAPTLEAGLVDFTQVVLGMIDKGSAAAK